MDFNLVVLGGRLAAPAEYRIFPSGADYLRLLVTVRSTEPRCRVDVVPATLWDPDPDIVSECETPGRRLFVVGALQRRFWADGQGRRSRLEMVARHVEVRDGLRDETDDGEGAEEGA